LCPVFQRYILKAIHNSALLRYCVSYVVSGISKIHSESNSQPSGASDYGSEGCGIEVVPYMVTWNETGGVL